LIPSIVGVFIGYFVLRSLDDVMTKRVIGWTILAMLLLQFLRMRSPDFLVHLPQSRRFLAGSGLVEYSRLTPEVRERLTSLGADPLPMSPAQFDAMIRDEMVSNAAIIKAAGIKPE
jgi:hypothetical protein